MRPHDLTYAEAAFNAIRECILVLDSELNVRMANRAFYETFHLKPEDTLDKSIWRLAGGQWNISRLRFLLENVQSSIQEFKNFELEHQFKTICKLTLLLNSHLISSCG